MKVKTKASILRASFTAFFAALICIGCFISIPMPGGVPITVQNLFAILAALILGGVQGASSVGLFLILGIIGVPVFSGVKGGWAVFVGPTGGYLWGYFIGAVAAGLIVGTPHTFEKKFSIKMWIRIIIASLVGFALIYAPGIPWFIHYMSENGKPTTLQAAIAMTVTPFIPGDVIKFVLSIPLAAVLRPIAARYLYPNDEEELSEIMEDIKKRKELHDKIANKLSGKKEDSPENPPESTTENAAKNPAKDQGK